MWHDVLDRKFQADGPNQKWSADFTYIWTADGWLYVAAVLDLYLSPVQFERAKEA